MSRPSLESTLPHRVDTGSFPGVKCPGTGLNNPLLSSAKLKERVELYLYSPSALKAGFRVNFTFKFHC